MKIIIPAAGQGTRLKPHTTTKPKPILPIAGESIIDFIMDEVETFNDVEEIIFIVGYLKNEVINYITKKYPLLNISFIEQEEYKGLAHAVYLAKEKTKDTDSIFIILGDTIFKSDLASVIEKNENSLGVCIVDDPSRYGVVILNEDKSINYLVEKPSEWVSNLAITGLYYIKDVKELFESIEYIMDNSITTKNEFQLTDALEVMIKKNIHFSTFALSGWFDCGMKSTMLLTNKEIIEHKILSKSINYTVLIPPVFIDEDVIIEKSVIGPYVHIGKNTVINSSVISNSIIFNDVKIENATLTDSIISEYSTYKEHINSVDLGANSNS